MIRFFLTLFIVTVIVYNSNAQYFGFDYTPAQITGLPMHYLPSFAGNLGQVRIASESQLYKESGYYRRFDTGVSVDGFIPKISSGLGVSFSMMDYAPTYSSLDYNYYNIGIAFAPKISIRGKYTLSPGISMVNSIHRHYLAPKFAGGVGPDNNVIIEEEGSWKLDYVATETVSLLFNTKKIYIGTGFNTQIQDFSHWKFFLQTGATFQRSDESKFSFSPSIIWVKNRHYLHSPYSIYGLNRFYFPENVTLNFRYQKVLWGIGFTGFMVGFQNRNFRIMYTTNAYLSRNTITLRILFNNKNQRASELIGG